MLSLPTSQISTRYVLNPDVQFSFPTLITTQIVTNFLQVFLFWVAFILTRPFGATFGDLMTKSEEKGGKGLGTFQVSMVLLGMFLFAFAIENYQLYKRKQLKKSDTEVAKNSKVVEQETFHIEDGAGVQDEEGRSRH